jgi:hypothetical protein
LPQPWPGVRFGGKGGFVGDDEIALRSITGELNDLTALYRREWFGGTAFAVLVAAGSDRYLL